MEPLRSDIEECNIGTEQRPKLIKLSKALPQEEILKYIALPDWRFLWCSFSDVKLGISTVVIFSLRFESKSRLIIRTTC